VANTIAYYDTATITAVKSFIVQASEPSRGRKFYVYADVVVILKTGFLSTHSNKKKLFFPEPMTHR
jgi:hypothetical protein